MTNFGVEPLPRRASSSWRRRRAPRPTATGPLEPDDAALHGLRVQDPGEHGSAATAIASPSCASARARSARHGGAARPHRQEARARPARCSSWRRSARSSTRPIAGDIIGHLGSGRAAHRRHACAKAAAGRVRGHPALLARALRARAARPTRSSASSSRRGSSSSPRRARCSSSSTASGIERDPILGAVGVLQFEVIAAPPGAASTASRSASSGCPTGTPAGSRATTCSSTSFELPGRQTCVVRRRGSAPACCSRASGSCAGRRRRTPRSGSSPPCSPAAAANRRPETGPEPDQSSWVRSLRSRPASSSAERGSPGRSPCWRAGRPPAARPAPGCARPGSRTRHSPPRTRTAPARPGRWAPRRR